MRRFVPDERYSKTYVTDERLNRALVKYGLEDTPHTVYRFPNNRVTALFYGITTVEERGGSGFGIAQIAQIGFPVTC